MTTASERKYGLSTEETAKLKEVHRTSPKAFPNPHQKGCYKFILETLWAMGANEWHGLNKLVEKFKTIAPLDWVKDWAARDGKPVADRLWTNVQTLQRVNDYGLSLLQVGQKVLGTKGCVLDIQRKGDSFEIRLNTNASVPVKAGRAAKVAPKPAPKPTTGTRGKGKAKFAALHAELCRAYGKTTTLGFSRLDESDSGSSHYRPAADSITLCGRLSVVTYLHEFAHALGRDEQGAVRWSVSLFRIGFPRSFARCGRDGHMLRRGA